MDNVIPFDPSRPRRPGVGARIEHHSYTEIHPLWLDGDLTFGEIWRALNAAGYCLRSEASGFVITRA